MGVKIQKMSWSYLELESFDLGEFHDMDQFLEHQFKHVIYDMFGSPKIGIVEDIKTELAGENLKFANLRNFDLRGVDFSNTILDNADFKDSIMYQSDYNKLPLNLINNGKTIKKI